MNSGIGTGNTDLAITKKMELRPRNSPFLQRLEILGGGIKNAHKKIALMDFSGRIEGHL